MSALNPFTGSSSLPDHLQRGQYGEKLARRFLQRRGLKYLTRNYASVRGEIDLLFRECQTLVFVGPAPGQENNGNRLQPRWIEPKKDV